MQESRSLHDIMSSENSLSFHSSFFISIGVFTVVALNLLFDYINYRGSDCKEERKDLLLTMRGTLSFLLILPTMVVYTCRAFWPERTAGIYLVAVSMVASIMNYLFLSVIEQSVSGLFSRTFTFVMFADVNLFLILFVLSTDSKEIYWLRACLAFTFILTYLFKSVQYLRSIDIWSELSITTCTRESIVFCVGGSPFPWVFYLSAFYIQNGGEMESVKHKSERDSMFGVILFNVCVIIQCIFLIICPERIARLLVTKMKGNVINTAKKLNNTIQPSILLLKRTISMLRRPQVMNAKNNNEALKGSYDNLVFACERVMKDIEDLQKDELFVLNSTGGFRPSLVTVSEEYEVHEWTNVDSVDHPEYTVLEFSLNDQRRVEDVACGKEIKNADDASNAQDDIQSTQEYNFHDHGENKSEDDLSLRRPSRPISEISALSDDTYEYPNLEPLHTMCQNQSQDFSNASQSIMDDKGNREFQHDTDEEYVEKNRSKRNRSASSSKNESLFDIFF